MKIVKEYNPAKCFGFFQWVGEEDLIPHLLH